MANTLSVPPVSSVANPARLAFNRNFGPTRPKRSCPHDQPSTSDKNTSNAIRACSRANSCAEVPIGNDSKNNLAATSGISLDSGPAPRQNFRNLSRCTLHQYSVLSGTAKLRPCTIRTTQSFGCSATILSFPSLMPPILQRPPELSTFFSP
ncbi:MAG: hypothetical protein NTW41_00090 [Verrucomicrobia bacterium]|nr:hypothetical protein [Verrucomicrobiota bacterium]